MILSFRCALFPVTAAGGKWPQWRTSSCYVAPVPQDFFYGHDIAIKIGSRMLPRGSIPELTAEDISVYEDSPYHVAKAAKGQCHARRNNCGNLNAFDLSCSAPSQRRYTPSRLIKVQTICVMR